MEKCITTLIDLLPVLVPTFLSGIISYWISIYQAKKSREQLKEQYDLNLREYKNKDIYEKKREAIYKALHIIDTYYSWMVFDSKNRPIPVEITENELTNEVRDCYNGLCVTCGKKITEQFVKMIFEEYDISAYNQLRNLAREELGLEKIELSRDHVFISRVSTNLLNEKDRRCHQASKSD